MTKTTSFEGVDANGKTYSVIILPRDNSHAVADVRFAISKSILSGEPDYVLGRRRYRCTAAQFDAGCRRARKLMRPFK